MGPTSACRATRRRGDHPPGAARDPRGERGDPSRNGRSPHPLTVALVVVGVLCVPLAVVSSVLGRFPTRGASLAAAILFTSVWAASMIHLRPGRTSGSDRGVRSPAP